MEKICDIGQCSGCGACKAKCPVGAIRMIEGSLGALHPCIDQEKCIDCGLCVRMCPEVTPVCLDMPEESYASYAVSSDQRLTSASGGVASVLAEVVLSSGGVVYGCIQEKGARICHGRVDRVEDVYLLKGSRYVNSSLENIWMLLQKDLDAGLEVLFVGTPCQVAAVKKYAGGKAGKLILVDLCCHGTPPYRLLMDHLENLGRDYSDSKVSFRMKCDGKIKFVFNLIGEDGGSSVMNEACEDDYMTGFLCGLFLRENCFSCRYARRERCGDITLADHWGMGASADPEMSLSKGLSTILVNTETGKGLLDRAAGLLALECRPFEESFRNGQFIRPFTRPDDYEKFVRVYAEYGYAAACRRFIPRYQRAMRIKQLKDWYYRWPFRQFIRKKLKSLL